MVEPVYSRRCSGVNIEPPAEKGLRQLLILIIVQRTNHVFREEACPTRGCAVLHTTYRHGVKHKYFPSSLPLPCSSATCTLKTEKLPYIIVARFYAKHCHRQKACKVAKACKRRPLPTPTNTRVITAPTEYLVHLGHRTCAKP